MTVAAVCDLFLDHSEKHHKPETFQLYRYYLQDFCDTDNYLMETFCIPFGIVTSA